MILVTGGSGFIGSALVRAFVTLGLLVRVLDDNSRGNIRRLWPVINDIEFIEGDVRNPAVVDKACIGVDEVLHFAFVNGTENFYKMPGTVLDVGVRGICNIIASCHKYNVKHLMVASSSEVYQAPPVVPTDESAPLSIPDPHNPRYSYGAGKIISEMMALHCTNGIDRVTIVRPHNIYGPDMGNEHVIPQIALRIKEEGAIRFYSQGAPAVNGKKQFYGGEETRAFCYIDDAVDGILVVWRSGKHKEIYNVGTQEEVAISDLAKRIGSHVGVGRIIAEVGTATGGTTRRCPDISKLRALGYSPKVTLDEGLAKTLDWYWSNARAVSSL